MAHKVTRLAFALYWLIGIAAIVYFSVGADQTFDAVAQWWAQQQVQMGRGR